MNEKVRSLVQAAVKGFLRRLDSLTLLDKLKSADILKSLNIESLLLRPEKIAPALIRTCDTNKVPAKNSQKTAVIQHPLVEVGPSQNLTVKLPRGALVGGAGPPTFKKDAFRGANYSGRSEL